MVEQRTYTIIFSIIILIAAFYMYVQLSSFVINTNDVKNYQIPFIIIFFSVLAILFMARKLVPETDPVRIREEIVNSTFGKQAKMRSLSEIGSDYTFDTMINSYSKERYYMWAFPSAVGWADIEIYQAAAPPGVFPLLIHKPHSVENVRLDVVRSDFKKAFLTGGTKEAIDILKREGLLQKRRHVRRPLLSRNKIGAEAGGDTSLGELRGAIGEGSSLGG